MQFYITRVVPNVAEGEVWKAREAPEWTSQSSSHLSFRWLSGLIDLKRTERWKWFNALSTILSWSLTLNNNKALISQHSLKLQITPLTAKTGRIDSFLASQIQMPDWKEFTNLPVFAVLSGDKDRNNRSSHYGSFPLALLDSALLACFPFPLAYLALFLLPVLSSRY